MVKKRSVFVLGLLIAILIISSLNVYAADENSTALDKAYNCIRNKVNSSGEDCSKLLQEEQLAVLLSLGALGTQKDCLKALNESSLNNNGECWPSTSCKLKDTVMALLAMEKLNQDTSKIESWLLNQTKIANELIWYLQVDQTTSGESTSCTVKSSGTSISFQITADKKITGFSGDCFSVSENGYWLQMMDSSQCLEKEYTISCDKEFATTLLYKTRQDNSPIHVTKNNHGGVAGGETTEKVIYKCFKQGTVCNYEGSLWATMALAKKGHDIQEYYPYLDASISESSALFPEVFLFISTGFPDYLSGILGSAKFKGKYWIVGSYNKYYSTALAFLALQGGEYSETAAAKEYLLNGKNQDANGCWNNVADTGLLLYAGWPSDTYNPPHPPETCESDSECAEGEKCEAGECREIIETTCAGNNKFCVPIDTCTGTPYPDYSCLNALECCDAPAVQKTCSESGGSFCSAGEECPAGETVYDISDYSEMACCLAACVKEDVSFCEDAGTGNTCKASCADNEAEILDLSCIDSSQTCCKLTETPPESECINAGNNCRSSCTNGETEEASLSCDSSADICCKESSGGFGWLIWVLLILIILVVLGIVFREKLKIVVFKFKSKFKKGPAPKETRPPFMPPRGPPMRGPPMSMQGRRPMMMPGGRPVFPASRPPAGMPPRPAPRPASSAKDKEYDETLRKLRDMSK
jgi:hypothetical protein